mmetsp:Transcript_29359/g.55606  ORF Transcript_29359/g.55606 Transcript_29359/m.55606 type:complete len:87 (+) Transcript_29359:384-644(+)
MLVISRLQDCDLAVQVLNNLDLDNVWNCYLETSLGEWDSSVALSLSLRTVTYDTGCSAMPWAINVYNDNFEKTGWKGGQSNFTFRR